MSWAELADVRNGNTGPADSCLWPLGPGRCYLIIADRVGIRGWSFGGSLAALAVLRRPDAFHAAVAGAAVTDQLLYNAHWRERFLGHPDEFPERYKASSLVLAAPKLTRPLLLIHGLADDNVFRRTRCACPARYWPPGARTRYCSCPASATRRWARRSLRTCYGIRCVSCSGT